MKGSLKGLARRLKEEIGDGSEAQSQDTRILETRRVLTTSLQTFESQLPISFEVVPPVPVVPSHDINGLDWNDQGGSRSFQSFQSIETAQALAEDQPAEIAGLSEHFGEEAEEAERLLRVEASLAFERDEVAQQSIPHETMVAGLLAASRMRPKLVIQNPLVTTDPWAAGVAKLQGMAPRFGFSAQQWRQAQQGCASLLASYGPEMTRLGWTTEDAFGVHPEVGGNAVHCFGLGLLLGDARVIEMTEAGARISLRSGVQQSFTRRPNDWTIPIWNYGVLK